MFCPFCATSLVVTLEKSPRPSWPRQFLSYCLYLFFVLTPKEGLEYIDPRPYKYVRIKNSRRRIQLSSFHQRAR